MKKIPSVMQYLGALLLLLCGAPYLTAGESKKNIGDDILKGTASYIHDLPQRVIESFFLPNHPIVPFILKRIQVPSRNIGSWDDENIIHTATFNTSGNLLATLGHDRNANLWNAETGELIRTISGDEGVPGGRTYITSIQFNSRGDQILVTSLDKAELFAPHIEDALKIFSTESAINSASFNPSGDLIITAHDDGRALLWDITSSKVIKSFSGPGRCTVATFSPSGKLVVTGYDNGTVLVWNTSSGKLLKELSGLTNTIWSAEFNAQEDRILTRSEDGMVKLWDIADGSMLSHINVSYYAPSAQFNQAGDLILVIAHHGGTASRVIIVDGRTGKFIRTIKEPGALTFDSAKFNNKGDMVLTKSSDGSVRLWSVLTGKILKELLSGEKNKANSILFDPSGDHILCPLWDGTMEIFDIGTLNKLYDFLMNEYRVTMMQAIILDRIYDAIICKRLHTLRQEAKKPLPEPPTDCRFDISLYPLAIPKYEKLPIEIRNILDPYVKKE